MRGADERQPLVLIAVQAATHASAQANSSALIATGREVMGEL
jgi:hypothetical protein